ncbi:MAG: ABC transporter permease [Rhodoglobus sp.]
MTSAAVAMQDTPSRILRLSFFLGWQDVRLMYRRSVLGQFWITISMVITFLAIGSVFGLIFKSPVVEYLPFLGCGLVFWNFLSLIVSEGAVSFIVGDAFIRQLPLPPIIFFLRSIWKTVFVLLHNAIALVLLLVVFGPPPTPAMLLVIPAIVLGGAGMAGLALALAVLATRYRDVPQILAALIQVLFYLTPIVWLPQAVPEEARALILTFNPFFHMIQIMRQPLLGELPTLQEWATAGGLAAVFLALGALVYARNYHRLAFWL